MKHEILPQEMSILRKLASRVWGNVGESKKCIKGHQKNCSEQGGVPQGVTSFGDGIHGSYVKDAPGGGTERGTDGKSSEKSGDRWM